MLSVLVGNDVILDYLLDKEGTSTQSIEIVSLCKDGRVQGWILDQTISEAYRICSQELYRSEIVRRVRELLEFLTVIPQSKNIILNALSEADQNYDERIQIEAVREVKLDFLITNNKVSKGKVGDIRILTPKELIAEILKEEINSVPALDLKRETHTYWDEVQEGLNRVIFSTNFILGDSVREFEKRFAEYCEAEYCMGVASGSDALLISLMALDIGPEDAVITTPYTFFSTVGAIARLFALPVFVDIDPATYNIDAGGIEKLIDTSCNWDGEGLWIESPALKTSYWSPEYFPKRRRIRAIIPVHLFGQTAAMGEIMEIAKRYNLYIIEDAAQAHGAECQLKNNEEMDFEITNYESTYDSMESKRVGSIGHLTCFSFFPTKNLGCWGDGGAVSTNDPELAERIRILRVHGSNPKYYHKFVGLNSRLDTVQAAVLLAKLPFLDTWIEKRQKAAQVYMDLLYSYRNLTLPEVAGYATRHVWNQFVVGINGDNNRSEVQNKLKDVGIATGIYYPLPLHLQECFSYLGYKVGEFPNSERAARETLTLPMYPEIGSNEQEEISKKLGKIL